MSRPVRAIFENGVFRPLEPVTLPEHRQVMVSVDDSSPAASQPRDAGQTTLKTDPTR